MSELEHYFGLARREAVYIGDAPAQNERVVVQPGVLGIYKQDFPDLERYVFDILRAEFHTALIVRRPEHLCELKQVLARPEP
ncbi:MAG: hypothetical protein WBC72_03760, partial [Pseudolabrys sp.]